MVSEQYHVNVAMSSDEDVTRPDKNSAGKVRDLRGSISGPIPGDQDVPNSVLEYFGITPPPNEKIENQYTMHAHNRLVNYDLQYLHR